MLIKFLFRYWKGFDAQAGFRRRKECRGDSAAGLFRWQWGEMLGLILDNSGDNG